MKLGKVKMAHEYTVDLENEEMIRHATESLYEDITNAIKYDELHLWLTTEEDPSAKEENIADFLLVQDEEDEYLPTE